MSNKPLYIIDELLNEGIISQEEYDNEIECGDINE